MALDPAKPLNIDAIETALDELLERYRQALRAVELLPSFGRLSDNECTVEILPVGTTRRRLRHLRKSSLQTRARHVRYSAVRRFARMFLRSHIRSKLRTIADRLEIERFASGHMDANTLKRLDDIIRRLRDYDKSLARGRMFGPKSQEWIWRIWPVAAPVLFTYLTAFFIHRLPVPELLGYIIEYMLYLAIILWLVLLPFVGEGGFRWKRLILLGQTGDMDIYRPNTVLRWMPGPRANTYEAENRFFVTLGVPKPDEFPWDYAFMPHIFLFTPLALSFLVLAIDVAIHVKEPGWPALIAIVLLVAFFSLLWFIRRSISKVRRERRQRGAC